MDTLEVEGGKFRASHVAEFTVMPERLSLACEDRQVVAFLSRTLSLELIMCFVESESK